MKVIVTGANGFVGRYLVRQLIEDGDDVIALTSSILNAKFFTNRNIPFEVVDITDKEIIDDKLPNKADAVVHLAALLRIERDKYTPEQFLMVNGIGTYNMLEYCRENKIPKFIYSMTHSDIDATRYTIVSPSTPRAYTSSYKNGENVYPFIFGKMMGADLVLAYDRDKQIKNGLVYRLSNIRGYGSRDTRYNCVFHQLIQKAIKGEDIEIWGDHKTFRDMIYVKDVVSAIISGLKSDGHGLYTIGTGERVTIEDEVKAIIDAFSPEGKKSKIIYCPDIKEVRTKSITFSILDALADLHWAPKYNYKDAMKDYKIEMEKGIKEGGLWQ